MDHSIESCVLWVYELDQTGKAKKLELGDSLEQLFPSRPNAWLWIHVVYDHPDARQFLDAQGIPESAMDTFLTTESRPTAQREQDHCLIMLRAINLNQKAHPEQMISLRIWLGQRVVITARRSAYPLASIRSLQDEVVAGKAGENTIELTLRLVELITDRIRESVDHLEAEIAKVEDDFQKADFKTMRNALSIRRREAAGIARFLAPQRIALEGFARHRSLIKPDYMPWLQDLTDRTVRYIEDLDLVREKALVLQDDLRAQIGDEQNQRMYVLSIVTALFLPLSFLTGLFGMNVGGLPGTETSQGFLFVCIGMIGLGIGVGYLMHKRKWF